MSFIKKISIGTAQFGLDYGVKNLTGQINFPDAKKIINEAYRNNIRSIDTAASYGNAETILGELETNKFDITTKLIRLPYDEKKVEKWVFEQVEMSLTKLNRDVISGILIHDPEILRTDEGKKIFSTLRLAKKKNLIQDIGVSIYHLKDLPELIEEFEIDIVQAPFNVFDRRLEREGWIDELDNKEIKIQVRSVFLQGLMLMEIEELKKDFNSWIEIFEEWKDWLKKNNLTSYEACLVFIEKFSKIDKVIIGLDSIEQFKMLLNHCKSAKRRYEIPEIFTNDLDLIDPLRWPMYRNKTN